MNEALDQEAQVGGLLAVTIAGFPVALELGDVMGLVSAPRRLVRPTGIEDSAPWLQGLIRYRRREIPLVSLGTKLAGEEPPLPAEGQAVVIDFAGNWLALRIDSIIELEGTNGGSLFPMPAGLSELPHNFFKGWVQLGDEAGAMVMRLEALFDDAELEELGRVLL